MKVTLTVEGTNFRLQHEEVQVTAATLASAIIRLGADLLRECQLRTDYATDGKLLHEATEEELDKGGRLLGEQMLEEAKSNPVTA